MSRRDGQGDLISHAFQSGYMIACLATRMEPVEVALAEVEIIHTVSKHVAGGDQLAVPEGHDGSLAAATARQAVVEAGEVGRFGACRGPGRLGQDGLKPSVALVDLARLALTVIAQDGPSA